MPRLIRVYTREGCHLCEDAIAIVTRVAAGVPDATVELVDIDADAALVDRYTVRVPVVEVDGTEVAEFMVDEAGLRLTLGVPR